MLILRLSAIGAARAPRRVVRRTLEKTSARQVKRQRESNSVRWVALHRQRHRSVIRLQASRCSCGADPPQRRASTATSLRA
ncbi:hypothetical protein, partial [Stenotrophomonas maltophilia]|uniref:hypothetical protein n=1 Tax=Stenotrophomonas maltophilia TaxID=40324 RepID=UPI001939DF47